MLVRERACGHDCSALAGGVLHPASTTATLGDRVVLVAVSLGIGRALVVGLEVLARQLCTHFRRVLRSVLLLVDIRGLLVAPVCVVPVVFTRLLLVGAVVLVVVALVGRF